MSAISLRRWPELLRSWFAVASGLWLAAAVLLLAISYFWSGFHLPWKIAVYLGLTVFFSPLCFFTYWLDKRRATRNQWRISEKMLHVFALLGGWPGGVIARRTFRHKTQKISFRIVFWLIVAAHLALIAYGIYLLLNQPPTLEPPPAA